MKRVVISKNKTVIEVRKSYTGEKDMLLCISENNGHSYVSWALNKWEAKLVIRALSLRLDQYED